MANPVSKGWKYLLSSLDRAIDENADPKVQIQQAIDAAKSQHKAIVEQAAAVLGNKRQLEMKINKLVKDQQSAQEKARTAIVAADEAAAAGDTERANDLNGVAEVLATQLVTVEQQLEETKTLYSQAEAAATQATKQVKESEMRLQEQMSQINELAAQADQAALQESTVKAMDSIGQFSKDDSVPTLDAVREKIERRYANALGAQELTEQNISGRMAEISETGRDALASARLAEIRAELGGSETKAAKELEEAPVTDAADEVVADEVVDADVDDVAAEVSGEVAADSTEESTSEAKEDTKAKSADTASTAAAEGEDKDEDASKSSKPKAADQNSNDS